MVSTAYDIEEEINFFLLRAGPTKIN